MAALPQKEANGRPVSRSQGSAGTDPYREGTQTLQAQGSKKHMWIERWVSREKTEPEV